MPMTLGENSCSIYPVFVIPQRQVGRLPQRQLLTLRKRIDDTVDGASLPRTVTALSTSRSFVGALLRGLLSRARRLRFLRRGRPRARWPRPGIDVPVHLSRETNVTSQRGW